MIQHHRLAAKEEYNRVMKNGRLFWIQCTGYSNTKANPSAKRANYNLWVHIQSAHFLASAVILKQLFVKSFPINSVEQILKKIQIISKCFDFNLELHFMLFTLCHLIEWINNNCFKELPFYVKKIVLKSKESRPINHRQVKCALLTTGLRVYRQTRHG